MLLVQKQHRIVFDVILIPSNVLNVQVLGNTLFNSAEHMLFTHRSIVSKQSVFGS